jgi:hypothetical protein
MKVKIKIDRQNNCLINAKDILEKVKDFNV